MQIADGLMSEDEYLVSEILFNPHTPSQLQGILDKLSDLLEIVKRKDSKAMSAYLAQARENIK